MARRKDNIDRKRGALSTKEMEFIIKSAPIMTADEIAIALKRTPAPIKKYIKEQNIKSKEVSDHEYMYLTYLNKLRTQPYYKFVVEQLSAIELTYFEDTWVKLMSQFKEDVQYAEELQLKQWILIEILINRLQMERKKCSTEIEAIEDEIVKQKELGDAKDAAQIALLETKMSFLKASLQSYNGEHGKLLDKAKDLQRELKIARDQRVKKFDDMKSNFVEILKILEERDTRIKWGKDLELTKLAGDKAQKELAQYHKYLDGTVDQPLLTPETVLDDNT